MTKRTKHSAVRRAIAAVALTAAASSFTACESVTSPAGDARVIEGRVTPAGPGDLTGYTARWRPLGGASDATASIDGNGRFVIESRDTAAMGELLIDGPAPRDFHPFLYPFHADSVGQADLVLVPARWTVQQGVHAGAVVETSLDLVMDDDDQFALYSYFWGRAHPRADPLVYRTELVAWLDQEFPVSVAFDHANGTTELTPADSVAIWDVLNRMEEVFGVDLFEPVVADPSWWPEPWRDDRGYRSGVIRVVHDPPSWHGIPLSGEEPLLWAQDLGEWAAGGRFTAFEVTHQLLDGGLLVVGAFEPLRLADGFIPWETVFMHEILHVLGAGHTCRIPSPQGPCMRTAEPSSHDVAYLELLRATMALERERGSFLGIMPATIGERRVILGASALPELPPRS